MKIFFPVPRLLVFCCLAFPVSTYAQKVPPRPKPNWQNLDLKVDGMFGISTEKAYAELLAGKKHVPVTVAVIDGGVDINHEDLKQIIWVNPGEQAGNGVDDDKNGYTDDLHGWDFIGSATQNVVFDNMEITRLLRDGQAKYQYANTATLNPEELIAYHRYQKMNDDFNQKIEKAQRNVKQISDFKVMLDHVTAQVGTNPSIGDFIRFEPQTNGDAFIKRVVLENMQEKTFAEFVKDEIDDVLKYYQEQLKYHLNMDYDSRPIVGDNYRNSDEHFYGNADVTGATADHGTHVSGIIAAIRDNNIGLKGVANDVRIMSVRTVPNGDERDKDVANAIRYAASNGAKVINMSFGKAYSYDKKAVDEAVKFAMSKDVLIVHAAGNDNEDTDTKTFYPNRNYADGGTAAGWIEVGASGFIADETLKASFSNFGKTSVDVFAPGVKIYSAEPDNKYKEHDGTSMAAPVVAGLAALIRSYYPDLTAAQVKSIILKSVVKVDRKVSYKVGEKNKKIEFSELCVTGGIVNAYNALKLAESPPAP